MKDCIGYARICAEEISKLLQVPTCKKELNIILKMVLIVQF